MRDEDIPFDTTARDKRQTEREARRAQGPPGPRYSRSIRTVACAAVGFNLGNAGRASVADDFKDGTADYITRPAPRYRQLEDRACFNPDENSKYLQWLAKEQAKQSPSKNRPRQPTVEVPSVATKEHGTTERHEEKRSHADDWNEEDYFAERRAALARRFNDRRGVS